MAKAPLDHMWKHRACYHVSNPPKHGQQKSAFFYTLRARKILFLEFFGTVYRLSHTRFGCAAYLILFLSKVTSSA